MAYTDFCWITDRLAIGGWIAESYDDLPFDAVLSLETHAPVGLRNLVYSGRVDYQWRSIVDGVCDEENDEIVRRFDAAAEQIHLWLEAHKRVLVHCFAGVSRSATAIVWYLVRYEGLSWDEAVALLRAQRSIVNPNIRFEIPLRLARGEDLDEAWISKRVQDYCDRVRAEFGWVVTADEIWEALEDQGTFYRRTAAAS